MKTLEEFNQKFRNEQSGAALVTVILISFLLVTAAAAMLSAVGASARNNSDALNEAKAYWAAESGLQATINVLRFQDVAYANAANDPDLSTWLNYAPLDPTRVEIDPEASYSIVVSDPDNSTASTSFTTTGTFAATPSSTPEAVVTFPGPTLADSTSITWVPSTATVIHPLNSNFPSLGSFQVTVSGAGGVIEQRLFEIDYRMTAPRTGTRTIRGCIKPVDSASARVDFYACDAASPSNGHYELANGSIDLCSDNTCAVRGTAFSPATMSLSLVASGALPVHVWVGPVEPYRLKVVATGYGPLAARKQLEGIIQRNFFNDFGTGNAITLVGPTNCMAFQVGTSAQMNIDGGQAPSIGVADADGLAIINAAHTNGTMEPPPAIYGDELPDWQQSVYTLDNLIRQLRQTAQQSGRYFTSGPTQQQGWGDFASGTGITFCEGSCTMGGNAEGGGILVITGTFYTQGNPKFKGLVLAVGPYVDANNPGGVVRGGGGNELFTGGIVIAPYDPNNLAAGFQCPRYIQNGGPGDTTNQALDDTFNGTDSVTNFMVGIAEK